MCTSECLCACVCRCLRKIEGDVRSPGAGVTGSCELPGTSAERTKLGSSANAASTCNYRAALQPLFFKYFQTHLRLIESMGVKAIAT